MKFIKLMMVLLAIVFVGNAVADVSWTGNGDDDLWTNPANWNTGVPPSASDTLGNTIFISGSAYNVIIDSDVTVVNDILGPEWGATLTIDGGSLTQVTTGSPTYYGWRMAPVSNILYDPPSTINVLNGGNLTTGSNLCIGENWWWHDGYQVNMNVYDTSTVTAAYAFLGGHLNLYGGTVSFAGLEPLPDNGYVHINIEEGKLILSYGDETATVNEWIAAGTLTAYGLTPGRGASIVIDTETIEGGTIVTAVYDYPATNPVPVDGSVGIGTLDPGTSTVDVTLNWWCGADPNGPVNPDILTHYVYMSSGNSNDPNLYYIGSVDQSSKTDPNVMFLVNDLNNFTVYYWTIEEGIDNGTGAAYAYGDPNNIAGPTWSFRTKAAIPSITDPANDLADPDASFTVTDENGVAAAFQWYKVGTPDVALSDTGAYSGTQTATLTVTGATLAEEGQYYCVATNGPNSDTSASAYLWIQRLMGHWKFEEDMTDSVQETVADAPLHDGSIAGSGPGDDNYAAGIDGNAMEFFNDGDLVEITEPGFFNFFPHGFTTSLWYKASTPLAGWRLPISKLDAGSAGWLFGVDHTFPAPQFTFILENPWYRMDGLTDTDTGDGNWHMLTVTYDPADTTIRLYTDGDEDTQLLLDLSTVPLSAAPLTIGGLGADVINGLIDDVQVYSYALTPTEVAQLYLDFETDKWVCVEDAASPLTAFDFNNDCRVTLTDFAALAGRWLDCDRLPVESCNWVE